MQRLGCNPQQYEMIISNEEENYKKIKDPSKQIHDQYIFYYSGLGFVLCIGGVIVGCSNVWICVLVLGIYRMANGMIWPVLTCKINNVVSSEFRSTVMPYQNMFTNILCIVADPIVGISLDWVGIERFYLAFGCIFAILILGLFLKEMRIKKKYSSQN